MAVPHIRPTATGDTAALGVRFHWARWDPTADAAGGGPPLVLLHGYPQTHYCWRLVAGPLAAATGRVVYAVDTKGNGESARPRPNRRTPAGRYDLDRLTDELRALLVALDADPAVLVGHDWGGVLAFTLAARFPALVDRLVLVDGPGVLPRNLLRMWYAALFQIPRLPEWAFRRGGADLMRRTLNGVAAPGRTLFTAQEAAVYYAPLTAPGGIEAALAYYRSAVWHGGALGRAQKAGISMPTLLVWGDHDPPLPLEVPRRMLKLIPQGQLAILHNTGHWGPEERPTDVVRLIRAFLAAPPGAGTGRIWTVP